MIDCQKYWPTDEADAHIDFIRDGHVGQGSKRSGDASWLRLTERWTAIAKSVFLFDVQGAVAKSTHAGLPWLLHLRKQCKRPIHFWPFDGWEIPPDKSAIVAAYPSLWMRRFLREARDGDEQAAYAVAAWLQRAVLVAALTASKSEPDAEELAAAIPTLRTPSTDQVRYRG